MIIYETMCITSQTDGHKVWANKGLIYQSWMPFDWKPAVTCCCSVNQKGKENKNTRGLPFNNFFFGGGGLNIVLYRVKWHILEGLVHLWTWMSPDKTDLFQDLTDHCWLLSEVQTFIMWFWINLIRHEMCFRFTVVVRSLETLTLNLNAMVILGLLIISLSCSFSKVERLYHEQY